MKIKRILISQPKPESGKSPYYDIAEKYNVKVEFRPFIKVDPIESKEFRQQRINIAEHTAIVFTSRTGIDHFFRLAKDLRVTVSEDMKYFCISEAVAFYLQKYIQYRKRKVFFGATGKLQDMMTVINKHASEKYLVVLPENNNEEIISLFEKSKAKHTIALMYRTVSNDFGADEKFDYDMLLFFSPQGIAALMKNFPEFDQGEIAIGCLGSATAQAVRDAGLRLDVEVPSPKYTPLSVALDDFMKDNHMRK